MNQDKAKLKTQRLWRLLFRILFASVAFLTPIIIISIKYNLITKFNGYKFSAVACILILLIIWSFKAKLKAWIQGWEYSFLKHILLGFSHVYIFILILIVLYLAEKELVRLRFCIEWISLCESIAYIVLYPIEELFDYRVKRLIRGIERKEDYRSVMSEIEGGK